jgi:hypothetical protein
VKLQVEGMKLLVDRETRLRFLVQYRVQWLPGILVGILLSTARGSRMLVPKRLVRWIVAVVNSRGL